MLLSWQDLTVWGGTVTGNETWGALLPTCLVVSCCWLCSPLVPGKILENQMLGMYRS